MKRTYRQGGRGAALLTSLWALGVGCGLPAEEADPEAPDEAQPGEPVQSNRAALTRATSCEEVLTRIQASAIERLMIRAEELRQPPEAYAGEPGIVVDVAPELSGGNPLLAGGSEPSREVAADAAALAPGALSDPGFSGTTVQVRDVDEADVIKTEGDHLYVLQGSSLVKLRAWPAEELSTLAAVAIEGSPHDMFVSDGKAVVFSSVNRELAPADAAGSSYSRYYYYYPTYTKLTVLDVDRETPEVLRESYLEGYYVSSRRHESVVRAVIQDGYKVPPLDAIYIEYFSPFGEPFRQQDIDAQVDAWLERTVWAVSESELSDWLPRQFTAVDGEIREAPPACADFYQPELDLSQSGVTQIFSLDLDEDEGESALGAATVLARAERVYANDRVVLLSQTEYGTAETGYAETTNLHRFDLRGGGVEYTASGSLPGYVQSQFSLDEHDDIVRVSTTENRWTPNFGEALGPTNRIFTLATRGDDLKILGQTEVFGQNEQIFATRFIGELGYVVTFRQVDPLFVVDLSDPAEPAVVGELHVPGFSNFLYPLDDEHLLAIGRDATEEGVTLGVALSIFDVGDPAAPALAHKFVYSGDGYSEANIDHRAISFHPDGGQVAFPLTDYRTGTSSIEVLGVDTDTGFSRLGALTPALPEYTLEECVIQLGYPEDALDTWLGDEIEMWPETADYLLAQCRGAEQMRRGLFREDLVYGVSTQAVYAQQVGELGEPPAHRASLPPAYYYDYYYPGGGVIAGTAGAAGAAGAGSFEVGAGGSSMAGAAGAAGAGGAPSDL